MRAMQGSLEMSCDPSLLTHPSEAALIASLGDFPRVVAQAAQLREPHRVARYLEEVASVYHRWYDACRVTPQGDNAVEPVHHTALVAQRCHRSSTEKRFRPRRCECSRADVVAPSTRFRYSDGGFRDQSGFARLTHNF